MCPKIVSEETEEQTEGSTEKPDTSNANTSPDNATLGLSEEEPETPETPEEPNEPEETQDTETSEEPEEGDPRDKEIEELRQRVAALQQGGDANDPKGEEGGEEPETKTPQQVSDSLIGDLSDDEFDKITGSKDEFANFLSKFGNNIIAKSKETTIQDIPEIVSKSFDRQSKMKSARDNFYEKNPDLKKYSDYVGFMTNKLQSENPDKEITELLDLTEKEVRKNLSLNKTAVETERERRNNENRRPVNPGSGRGASRDRGSDTRTDQQKQIDDILI